MVFMLMILEIKVMIMALISKKNTRECKRG
jgi:hypothetical protein